MGGEGGGRSLDLFDRHQNIKTTSQTHLKSDVLKRGRRHDGEADEEDVGVRVAEGAEPGVVLMACRGRHTDSLY